MAIKDTTKSLKLLLQNITHDLDKAERGNKAASQRVRTGTVRLEKVAKTYRKESIKTEKQQPKSKTASKYQVKLGKGAAKPKVAMAAAASKSKAAPAAAKAKPKAKPAPAKTKKATARSRALAFQRQPTAKLPTNWS